MTTLRDYKPGSAFEPRADQYPEDTPAVGVGLFWKHLADITMHGKNRII
jgi:hypothetical protein